MKKVTLTMLCLLGLTFCIAQSARTKFSSWNPMRSTPTESVSQQLPSILKPEKLVEASKLAGFSFDKHDLFIRENARYNLDINHRDVVSNATILDLDLQQIQRFRISDQATFSLSLPLNTRADVELELVEVNIFTDDFKVVTDVNPEGIEVDLGKHYRGVVKGVEGSIAALSIFDQEVTAIFSIPNEGNFVLGKLEEEINGRTGTSHILYNDQDLLVENSFECQFESNRRGGYSAEELRDVTESRALTDCVRFYYEAENDIAQNQGGQQGATNYITSVHNQVAVLYANEGINTRISEIFVWTNPDPYTSNSTDVLLNGFQANRPNFNGDLSMLLTFRDIGGGIAYLDALCFKQFAFGVSGIEPNYQNVPTYSWTVGVIAHEFGHEFGLQHTHACVWNGNNTAIDGCFDTEGGCPDPGFPNNGGTIMSYCHLVDGVGINLTNGFGPQPTAVMRNNVQNANCLQPCDNNNNEPDYVAQFTGGPNATNAGATVTFNTQVTNQGNANGNSTSQSRYYLSTDQTFGQADLFLNQAGADNSPGIDNHPVINAGQSLNETENIIIPAGTANGNYFILYVVDFNNEVNESNENNNVASRAITIGNGGGGGGGLDCNNAPVISCGQTQNSTTIGQPSNVNDWCNEGVNGWTGPEKVFMLNWGGGPIQISLTNLTADVDLILLGSCDPNNCVDVSGELDTDDELINRADLAAGNYYIVVDGWEGAQSNFSLSISNCQGGGNEPDYTATNLSTNNNNVNAGATISMAVTIQNVGAANGTANGGKDRFFLSNNPTYDGGDIQVGEGNTASLTAGASFNVNGNVTIPGNTSNGNYYILFFIDADNQIAESNENNNVASYPITIGDGGGGGGTPDYAISNYTLNGNSNTITVFPGQTVSGSLIALNQGNGNATQQTTGKYYYSSDNSIDAADPVIGTDNISPLGAGQQITKTASIMIPMNAQLGNRFVFYKIDADNNINESNEGNNVGLVKLNVVAGGNGPVANFTANKTNPCVGETVQFTSTSTGNPTSYTWSFPGGTPSSSTSANPTVSYSNTGNYNVTLLVSNNNGNDTEVKNNYISVQTCGGNGPNWEVTQTGDNHTVILNGNASVTISGQPIANGDYIGAFFNDGGALRCGGKAQWTGNNISITIYGDDNTTTNTKEGFSNGETFQWKLWQATTDQEVAATATYRNPNGIISHTDQYAGDGISEIISLIGSTQQEQTITLQPGWNIISSYIQPVDPNLATVLNAVNTNIALVKNGNGQTYIPSASINQIGNWNIVDGYKLKVLGNSPINLKITGQKANPSTPINLSTGWNLFAYLKDSEQSIQTALSPIAGQMIIAKNNFGATYIPSLSINNIGNMQPGQGYQAKMSTAATLNYNSRIATPPANLHQAQLKTNYYRVNRQGGPNATMVLDAHGLLKYGDEIGVFNSKGKLVGSAVYEGYLIAFPIWGEDKTDAKLNGLKEGETFEIRAWRKNMHKEEAMNVSFESGTNTYQLDRIIMATLQRITSLNSRFLVDNSLTIYPNPAKQQATLRLELMQAAQVKIGIYNLQGSLLYDLEKHQLSAGVNELNLDTRQLPEGLYYCNIRIDNTIHSITFSVSK